MVTETGVLCTREVTLLGSGTTDSAGKRPEGTKSSLTGETGGPAAPRGSAQTAGRQELAKSGTSIEAAGLTGRQTALPPSGDPRCTERFSLWLCLQGT